MPSVRLEELTPFGRLAVRLDREMRELVEDGAQMEGVKLESDGGLDEGVRILNRVSARGESIGATMRDFLAALQEAQARAEAATRLVGERALAIKARRERQGELQDRLEKVQDELKSVGEGLARANESRKSVTDEDKKAIAAELAGLKEPLARFIEAAKAVKAEAAAGNFRRVERQADSIIDSLLSSSRKIAEALPPR